MASTDGEAERVAIRPARWVPDPEARADLRSRIRAWRPADHPLAGRWAHGTGTEVVEELLAAWTAFDEERVVARLDAFEQLDVDDGDAVLRVLHLRGETPDSVPVVLTHGWPSTVLELLPLAHRLARPSHHGAAGVRAFHVVLPALPGFPLARAPHDLDEYTAARIADRWCRVMAALGYGRFAASGGDIGARVTAWLGARHPDRVLGVHLSPNALWPEPPDATQLGRDERAWVAARERWTRAEGAYVHVHRTKPLSLAHGLADSPAGLAAWIVEKWHGWSEPGSDPLDRFGVDELLGHLTLYWHTNRIATSLLPYYVYDRPPGPRPWGGDVTVPVGFYLAPGEIGGIPPRAYAERQYAVARWSELPRGGHFVAAEEPDLLAADVRSALAAPA